MVRNTNDASKVLQNPKINLLNDEDLFMTI